MDLLSLVSIARGVEPASKDAPTGSPLWAVDQPVQAQDGPFRALNALPAQASNIWQSENVNCSQDFLGMDDHSLQVDADGHPHVAYGGEHLCYAWHDGSAWHYATVDASSVGGDVSLALDASGRPHISYTGDYELKYAWYDGSAWQIETVDSAGWVGLYSSLALDAAGYPHITGTGPLSLPLPIVNTAWLTNLDSGQSVSASAIVNSYWVYLPYTGTPLH